MKAVGDFKVIVFSKGAGREKWSAMSFCDVNFIDAGRVAIIRPHGTPGIIRPWKLYSGLESAIVVILAISCCQPPGRIVGIVCSGAGRAMPVFRAMLNLKRANTITNHYIFVSYYCMTTLRVPTCIFPVIVL